MRTKIVITGLLVSIPVVFLAWLVFLVWALVSISTAATSAIVGSL